MASAQYVFGKYILKKPDGTVDVSGIFSKECYDEWLTNRMKMPLRPPEAFRKAITAHCNHFKFFIKIILNLIIAPGRGDEGMAPFEPDVEAELLKILRIRQVWPCFLGTNVKIGKRGCQTTGFWEKRNENDAQSHNKRSGDFVEPAQAQKKPRIEEDVDDDILDFSMSLLDTEDYEPINEDLSYYHCQLYIQNEATYGRNSCSDYRSIEETLNSVTEGQEHSRDLNAVIDIVEELLIHGCDIVKQALKGILRFTPKKLLGSILHNLFQGEDMQNFYPKSVPDKLGMDANTAYFFSKEFCIPEPLEQEFNISNPVGKLYLDSSTMRAVDIDHNCQELHRGNIVGLNLLALRVNKLQGLSHVLDMLEEFVECGEVWTRSIEHRLDGTVMVLLNQYSICSKNPKYLLVRQQDVTQGFLHLL